MSLTRASCAASWAARSCCTASSSACFSAISSWSFFALDEHFFCTQMHKSQPCKRQWFRLDNCPNMSCPTVRTAHILLHYLDICNQEHFPLACASKKPACMQTFVKNQWSRYSSVLSSLHSNIALFAGRCTDLRLFMLTDLLLQISHIHLQLGPLGVPCRPLASRFLPLLFQVRQIALRKCTSSALTSVLTLKGPQQTHEWLGRHNMLASTCLSATSSNIGATAPC